MRFIFLKEIDSTQKYLLSLLKENKITPPVCIWSDYQTNGIGSRGNRWIGEKGNLFFSFAFKKKEFDFVPVESLSIYFGWIIKKVLNNFGSKVLLKWPNDLYLKKKVGGVITQITGNNLVCGIGINTFFAPEGFDCLDIKIKNDKILESFFEEIEKKIPFEEVITEYKKEFEISKKRFNIKGSLSEDGALIKNTKKVYSKR